MIKRLFKLTIAVAVLAGLVGWGYFAVITRRVVVNRWVVQGLTRGVDVSSYQTDVDFAVLREQGVDFAYVKATEGSVHKDASFGEKWAAAAEAGMPVGAYHYFSYESSGAKQAENFIATVGELGEGHLVPAIDMELTTEQKASPPEKADVVAKLKAFIATVEEWCGAKPLIYAQRDYYDKYLAEDFADYPRWVRNVYYPVWVDAGDNWVVWQYDDRGELTGYAGEQYIDLNVINGSKGLDALKIK